MKRLLAALLLAASTLGGVATMNVAHACTPGDVRSTEGQVYVCVEIGGGGAWIRP